MYEHNPQFSNPAYSAGIRAGYLQWILAVSPVPVESSDTFHDGGPPQNKSGTVSQGEGEYNVNFSLQFSWPERFQFYFILQLKVVFNVHTSIGKKLQQIYTLSYLRGRL